MKYGRTNPKVRYQPNRFQKFLNRVGTVCLFPFAFLWFFLMEWMPGLKKLWNPEVVKVYIVGSNLSNQHHGVARCTGAVKIKQHASQRDMRQRAMHLSVVPGPEYELAFRVDRPEELKDPSQSTMRAIQKKFEEIGYEIRSVILKVDGQEFIHMF